MRRRTPGARETALAAGISAGVGGAVLALVPPAGDASAHFYRTLLARERVPLWDELWYGGHYPFASYGALYYAPAALLGPRLPALVAGVAAAALFASLAVRVWGDAARGPARVFAVLSAGPLLLGQYPYGAGVAAGLGSLRALQGGRTVAAVALAGLTLAFSPLAFLFLGLLLAAVAAGRGRLDGRAAAVGAALAALAALQAATLLAFPAEQTYVFSHGQLLLVLALALPAAALAARAGDGALPLRRGLIVLLVLWALAAVAAFALPNPVGHNVARLRWLVLPLVILVASAVRFRPRAVALPLLALALAQTAIPYETRVRSALAARTNDAAFWAPALAFVAEGSGREHRIHVVPTGAHWEAYFVPRAGLALARGWYRQLDLARNGLFYEPPLRAADYRAWLREHAVRYVLLPEVRLDVLGAEPEAALLRSGRSGLVEVFRSADWRIFELPGAAPLLGGPAGATLTELRHDRIAGTADPGDYLLRARWSPYRRVEEGDACLAPGPSGTTLVRVRAAGTFRLGVGLRGALSSRCERGRRPAPARRPRGRRCARTRARGSGPRRHAPSW